MVEQTRSECGCCGRADLRLFRVPLFYDGAWAETSTGECLGCGSLMSLEEGPMGCGARQTESRFTHRLSRRATELFSGPDHGAAVFSLRLPLAQGPVWREFRDNWFALAPLVHRWVPTPDALSLLAEANGWVVDSLAPQCPLDHFVLSEFIARRNPLGSSGVSTISAREQSVMRRKARRCSAHDSCPEAIVRFRRVAS